jgi:hypothetical protein
MFWLLYAMEKLKRWVDRRSHATTPVVARQYRHAADPTSAPRVAPLMGVTAFAVRASAHWRRTLHQDPCASPRRSIDQSVPLLIERSVR